ncbi:MAG: amino acid ABC transporter ATP-binding protein [Firmicutes bacterium]|nr:amino acid ABC transporter ATP-binding protein [Bacillota bacterium]
MIEIRNLTKEYEGVTPLKDLSVTINDGDIIAVIGPSGTGKSTFLRCINLLETPTSGQILVDGEDITDPKCDINRVRKKMGMVFQSFNLFGHLTVIENIMNPQITLLGRSRQEAYDKGMDLLDKVGLYAKALNYPDELSGGQQQRIAIARTLAMDPEIILFDEPTSALDPSMIGEVQSIIRMIAKTGRTMMIVTHEMDFAKKIANRVFFMDGGTIYEEGTPREIFNNPKKEKTRRFVKRMSTLSYRIESREFNFETVYEELQPYAEKLLIENERISKVQIALEEICVNNLFLNEEEPNIYVSIDYSEKSDVLSLEFKYKGTHYDPSTSDNALFMSMLEEPTTTMVDEVLENSEKWYDNHTLIEYRWEDEK